MAMTRHTGGLERAERALRVAIAAVFLIAAGMKLAALDFEVAAFARFGYAPWFMVAIGAGQLAGAALLLTRRFAGAGALLLAAIMVGAVVSHLRAHDPLAMAVPASLLLVLLLGIAYARRRDWLGGMRAAGLRP
jgi:hypothetical protein